MEKNYYLWVEVDEDFYRDTSQTTLMTLDSAANCYCLRIRAAKRYGQRARIELRKVGCGVPIEVFDNTI